MDSCHPTGCPSPAAYSDRDHGRLNLSFKKATISRAKRSGAWAGWAGWPRTLTCCPHDRTTPARNHASTTSLDWNHTQHTITLPITGAPHHEPSNHTLHNERQHDEAGTTGMHIRNPRI